MRTEGGPSAVPDEALDELIEPEVLREVGDPVPVTLAASLVYVPVGLVGLAGILLTDGLLLGRCDGPVDVLREAGIGAGVGLAMVATTWILTRCLPSLQRLRDEFRRLLGRLSIRDVLLLALLSGVSEEIVFRGWMQPALGLVLTSVIFGLLHFVPILTFLPWTLFALAAGFILGSLASWRDSIVAPMTAHVLVNALNLHLIVRGPEVPRRAPSEAAV